MAGTESPQGPFAGSRCVAGPGERWGAATIRRANEDGTFTVELDVKEIVVMPYWYGVTPAEISLDDDRRWPPVFARLSPSGLPINRDNFSQALTALGYQIDVEQEQELWDHGCRSVFKQQGAQAARCALDEALSYQFFLSLGVSAKRCTELLAPNRPQFLFKLYWNQTRMGGRDPVELPRPVELADALAAIGLAAAEVDKSAAAFMRQFEREQGVQLPAAFVDLLGRAGVERAVLDCHPNNPRLVPLQAGEWKLRRGMRSQSLCGDYALVFMTPHQGDHEWAVIFDDQEADGRVYVRWDDEGGDAWLLSAPTLSLFFWDLAQTGLVWYQHTNFQGGKPVKRTDIGLIPV